MFNKKVYIASPFFNDEQLDSVKRIEMALSEFGVEFFSPRNFGVIKEMTDQEKKEKMKSVYDENVRQLKDCRIAVVVVDYPDTGTLFELGYSVCLKETNMYCVSDPRFIITLSFSGKPVNVMLRYGVDAHCRNERELKTILCDIRDLGSVLKSSKNFPEVNE